MSNNENSNIAQILQAIINGSTDYPDFKDNPPSRIATLLMLLGVDIAALKEIVQNLPDPLVPKGNLGTNPGDLPDLPTTGMSVGDTYFVATAGTYNNQPANIGDMFYYNANNAWSYVPTGDIDTWRNIFVNGTQIMGIDNKDALKLVDSSSVKVNYNGTNKEVSFAGLEVKSFTYTGDGTYTNTIQFADKPKIILSIQRKFTGDSHYAAQTYNIIWNYTGNCIVFYKATGGPNYLIAFSSITYDDVNNTMSITNTSSAGQAMNTENVEYTVLYI